VVSEEKIKSANQKEELPMAAIFVNGSGQNGFWASRGKVKAKIFGLL
jgi:hypothetical protein